MITPAKTKNRNSVADSRQAPTIEFRIGPDPRGPRVCIHCRQPFQKGERWKRMTSAPDPKFGVYSFGVHDSCWEVLQAKAA